MKNKVVYFLGLVTIIFPITFVTAGTVVNINSNGDAVILGSKVMQLAGGTLFSRMYWGDSYVRLTIRTNSSTKFYRATGEATTLSEIAEGNVLDVSGSINSGSDVLTITATSIKNESVQKKQNVFSGKVTSIDPSGSFTLNTASYGDVTVKTDSNTQFIKGSRSLDFNHLLVGDTITKASGDYDIPTKTLQATSIVTFVVPDYYKPKNFQGILQTVTGVTPPTSITVLIDGKSYTVNITSSTSILNAVRNTVLLSRFVSGDTVRIYGAIREVDDPIIDAQILRNISL